MPDDLGGPPAIDDGQLYDATEESAPGGGGVCGWDAIWQLLWSWFEAWSAGW